MRTKTFRVFQLALLAMVPFVTSEASETRRYLVATRGPAEMARLPLTQDEVLRVVRHTFRSVNGFAAELTDAQLEAIKESPDVLFVEPDPVRRAFGEGIRATAIEPLAAQKTPYGIDLVRAPMVWPLAIGTAIKVAVIDTGVDKNHPELKGVYRGGYDFINKDDDPQDDHGHGTHVSGTIAAANDAEGVVGVAPNVDLYALKVLDADGSGTASGMIKAVEWAIENKMNVLNLSLGSEESSLLEEEAFQRAADAGILTVAASGNGFSGALGLSYPAGYSTVLGVGAIDSALAIAEFSQRGPALDLVAPGIEIESTYSPDAFDQASVAAGGRTMTANRMTSSPRRVVSGAFVSCGTGKTTDFPSSVSGKIALIERGGLNPATGEALKFADKAKNAKAAGAIGMIVYNNVDGTFNGTLGDDNVAWPPSFGMSREDGLFLKGLASGSSLAMEAIPSPLFATLQGTSMACPHVAGVAALIWSLAPNAKASEVTNAMIFSARDLGSPAFDNTFGFGLVDALEAAKNLAPEKFVQIFPHKPRSRRTQRGGN